MAGTLKDLLLRDEAILAAFNGDFGEVYFGHKPTPDDILLIKLRLVAKAQLAKDEARFKERLKHRSPELRQEIEIILVNESVQSGRFDDKRDDGEVRAELLEQLVLLYPDEGGTDAISWGKGVEDGIKRERERILVEFDTMFYLAPENDSYLRLLVKDLYKAIKAGKWPNAELGQPLKAEKGEE